MAVYCCIRRTVVKEWKSRCGVWWLSFLVGFTYCMHCVLASREYMKKVVCHHTIHVLQHFSSNYPISASFFSRLPKSHPLPQIPPTSQSRRNHRPRYGPPPRSRARPPSQLYRHRRAPLRGQLRNQHRKHTQPLQTLHTSKPSRHPRISSAFRRRQDSRRCWLHQDRVRCTWTESINRQFSCCWGSQTCKVEYRSRSQKESVGYGSGRQSWCYSSCSDGSSDWWRGYEGDKRWGRICVLTLVMEETMANAKAFPRLNYAAAKESVSLLLQLVCLFWRELMRTNLPCLPSSMGRVFIKCWDCWLMLDCPMKRRWERRRVCRRSDSGWMIEA